MRITFCVLLYVIEIYYQQCFGLNFIDLPGFGSDEKPDPLSLAMKTKKNGISSEIQAGVDVSSENTDSDKKMQKKEQSLRETTESNYKRSLEQRASTSTVVMTTKTSGTKITIVNQPTGKNRPYPPVRPTPVVTIPNFRRHWLVSNPESVDPTPNPHHDDKDENIKSKISMLVQQTMHDTEIRMKTVQKIKERHRDEAPYRVGFILSMIKKSRDVLNELFNVAVKHRDEWKALEQLKIFELIVHTNVDTTNLVRQLVEVHIQHLNATAHGGYEEGKHRETTKFTTPPGPGRSRSGYYPPPDSKHKMVLV